VVYLIVGLVVLALVVLGAVAYGVLGAAGRLRREVAAAEREVRPLLTEVQATAARAAGQGATSTRGS
jgi:hypothetical protein